jgi:hypothetical protein
VNREGTSALRMAARMDARFLELVRYAVGTAISLPLMHAVEGERNHREVVGRCSVEGVSTRRIPCPSSCHISCHGSPWRSGIGRFPTQLGYAASPTPPRGVSDRLASYGGAPESNRRSPCATRPHTCVNEPSRLALHAIPRCVPRSTWSAADRLGWCQPLQLSSPTTFSPNNGAAQ